MCCERVSSETNCVWWKLRTRLEKCLLCSWTTVSLLFFTLSITIIVLASTLNKPDTLNVCVTKKCLNEASRIMKYLDESVQPCDDFYRFACGKWLDSERIPDQMNSISSFTLSQEQINWRLRKLLEEPIKEMEPLFVKNLKNVYISCTNLNVINDLSTKPLNKYLKELGGWPLLEEQLWNETNFNVIKMMAKIRAFGFENRYLYNLKVAPDFKRNTKFKIYFTAPVFGALTPKLLIDTNSTVIEAYLNFMVKIAVLLGANKTKAEQELKEVILFESKIALAQYKSSQRLDSYQYLTVKMLNDISPGNWTQILNDLLSIDSKINENEILLVWSVRALTEINQIINEFQQNNKRVLANYILWKIVYQSIKTLDKRYIELYYQFYAQISQLKRNTKRWKTCLNIMSKYMKTGLTSLYLINDEKKEKKREMANKMFETIRHTLNQTISRIDWMDESTRLNAVLKIKSINKFIAFNEEIVDQNKVNQFYDGLGLLTNDELFENLLKLQNWSLNKEYSKLRTKNDRNRWLNVVTTAEINAYYAPFINGIKIPIWILNGIFFDSERPNYLNYGSLGWVIGHELVHPFDKIGERFDNRGNLRDWWDVETKELFHNKSECFVKQYHDNFPNEVGVKSKLSEDMADNGGIQIAFKSYQEFVKNNRPELGLPSLAYTIDQLFWISAAQIWCSKLSAKGYDYFLKTSIHSLSEQRVIISFSNSEEFSKTFKCNKTDRMNPKQKCSVW